MRDLILYWHMQLDLRLVYQLEHLVSTKDRFLMVIDTSPDGDQIGASYALGLWLRSRGKIVEWRSTSTISDHLRLCGFSEPIVTHFEDVEDWDAIIVCDCGNYSRIGFNFSLPESVTLIAIDHHVSNNRYGDLNFIDSQVGSTCEIVYFLLKELHANITPDIAQHLLMGMYYDTGCFRHQCTTKNTFAVASSLCLYGAEPRMAGRIKADLSVDRLKKWGHLLTHCTFSHSLCSLHLTTELQDQYDISPDQVSGFSELLVTTSNSLFSLVAIDLGDMIKCSLRTESSDLNLTEIAQYFGGGGHQKASGFLFSKSDSELLHAFKHLMRTARLP